MTQYDLAEANARLATLERERDRLNADIFDILDITGDDLSRLRGRNGRSYIRVMFGTGAKDRLRDAVRMLKRS